MKTDSGIIKLPKQKEVFAVQSKAAKAVRLGRDQKPSLLRQYIKYKYLVFLFIPPVIFYLMFCYWPLYGVQIAFKDYSYTKGIWGSPWVGFQTFIDIFNTASFWQVFKNTLIISVYKFAISFPVPIIFAIFLNELRGKMFKKAVQTISYLPHFISWVVLGGICVQLLSPTTGPVNILIKAIGLEPIYFLGDSNWFRTTLVLTAVWKSFGWGSIVYLAALTGIDPTLYEAAYMDGANRFQRIIHITIPSITPVITIMLIMNIGTIVNDDFDQVFNLYNSAVYNVGDVLSTYTYRVGLVDMDYSFGTAVGLFKNVLAFALVTLANTISKRISEYSLW